MRIGDAEAPQPPTLSVLDDRLDELLDLGLKVRHGLGVESSELLSTLKRRAVIHTIGSEFVAVNAVVPCLTCRMLRLMKHIHAISDSVNCLTCDVSLVLE